MPGWRKSCNAIATTRATNCHSFQYLFVFHSFQYHSFITVIVMMKKKMENSPFYFIVLTVPSTILIADRAWKIVATLLHRNREWIAIFQTSLWIHHNANSAINKKYFRSITEFSLSINISIWNFFFYYWPPLESRYTEYACLFDTIIAIWHVAYVTYRRRLSLISHQPFDERENPLS